MKDEAPALDMQNNMKPHPEFKAFYGSTTCPHKTNDVAKKTSPSEIMEQVMRGK